VKIFHLPGTIRALAFDMDLTLYTNPAYGQYQIDSLVEKLAGVRGLSFDGMNREIEEARKSWTASHDGKKPSLSNIFMTYGITMEENIRWREEIYEPERFIKEDKRLDETLKELSRFYTLGVVTNNPVSVARKTLAALGVVERLPILVGLDSCMTAKPSRLPFERFSELSRCPPETCVSIGDRYDIDLLLPMEMGMGGIFVDGVEDVYELPAILAAADRTRGGNYGV
jgi:phosphoglycolate phosphatase/putative hydrolase of the HAD superfamily